LNFRHRSKQHNLRYMHMKNLLEMPSGINDVETPAPVQELRDAHGLHLEMNARHASPVQLT